MCVCVCVCVCLWICLTNERTAELRTDNKRLRLALSKEIFMNIHVVCATLPSAKESATMHELTLRRMSDSEEERKAQQECRSADRPTSLPPACLPACPCFRWFVRSLAHTLVPQLTKCSCCIAGSCFSNPWWMSWCRRRGPGRRGRHSFSSLFFLSQSSSLVAVCSLR